MAIRVATDATFEVEVIQNDRPVVVDFWAAWCGPCKLVAPEMEKIAVKYEGSIDVVKVDVDANPGLSRAFNIMSIPTIAFFAPGKQPMGVVGFRPMEQLETQFQLASYPKIEAAAAATPDGATDTEAAPVTDASTPAATDASTQTATDSGSPAATVPAESDTVGAATAAPSTATPSERASDAA